MKDPSSNKNAKNFSVFSAGGTRIPRFTKGCCQSILSFKAAAVYMFFLYLSISTLQGYFQGLRLILRSRGASFEDQSKLSFADYPYTFKFLFAPMLDRYFIKRVGKSRTYIIGGCAVIVPLFLIMGPIIEDLLDHKKILPLLSLTMSINCLVSLVQISGESWVLTLFRDDDEKSKASTFMNVGISMGTVLGYNLFIPLNDLEWLNDTFFENKPLNTPLVTNTMMCLFIAGMFFVAGVITLLFISEKYSTEKQASLKEIWAILPRHATNKDMRNFILYFFCASFVYYTVDQAFDLTLVQNGYMNLSPSVISNIDTLCYPIVFVLSMGTIYFMKKGQLIRMYHLNLFVVCFSGTFRYLMCMDLMINQNVLRTIIARCFASVLYGMDFTGYFLMAFFNTIVDESVGNTGITSLIAIMNQTYVLSATVGFALLQQFGFPLYVPTILVAQFCILVLLFPLSFKIDKKDAKLFDLSHRKDMREKGQIPEEPAEKIERESKEYESLGITSNNRSTNQSIHERNFKALSRDGGNQ